MIKQSTVLLAIILTIAGCGTKQKSESKETVMDKKAAIISTQFGVIPGFMIQGGDPLTKSEDKSRHGTGGNAAKFFGIGDEKSESSWDLPAEFSATPHERGILSMARSQNPDSGGSQFFICVADARFLDNQYTVFGKVVSGMDVVDAIVSVPRDPRDNPDDRIEMKVRLEDK